MGDSQQENIDERLMEGERVMSMMQSDILLIQQALTQLLEQQQATQKAHEEIMEVYKGIKAAIKVFGYVEKFCTWILKMAAAISVGAATVWAALGFPHPPSK